MYKNIPNIAVFFIFLNFNGSEKMLGQSYETNCKTEVKLIIHNIVRLTVAMGCPSSTVLERGGGRGEGDT